MEVEWGDGQFGRVLDVLKAAGELDRTLDRDDVRPWHAVSARERADLRGRVPRAARHSLAGADSPRRAVDDFVNFRDLAPTFLELAGLNAHPQMSGRSLVELLESKKSGWVDPARSMMLIGKERHDLGRPHDEGYPVRAIRTRDFLLVHNYTPDRWPAGNPETGLPNCDDGPSKSLLVAREGHFTTFRSASVRSSSCIRLRTTRNACEIWPPRPDMRRPCATSARRWNKRLRRSAIRACSDNPPSSSRPRTWARETRLRRMAGGASGDWAANGLAALQRPVHHRR